MALILSYIYSMKKRHLVSLQIAFWLSLPFIFVFFKWIYQFTEFLPGKANSLATYFQLFEDTFTLNLIMVVIGASTFYLTDLVILPTVLTRPRRAANGVLLIALLIFSPFLIVALFSIFSFAVYWSYRYFLFFAYLVQLPFILLGVAVYYIKRWLKAIRDIALLEKQALRTELELLKSQLNPHFLFNTINNIDTLILQNAGVASQYLNELADLLRFMLYEVKNEKISLSKEVEYIDKYIRLQKIRSVNPNFISLTVIGSLENQQIAPLLFIPLIENAFKHVPDKLLDDSIKIDFEISSDSLSFTCRNRFNSHEQPSDGNKGIGLNIITQRLKLQYKNRHQIEVKKDNGYYEVTLKLNLNAN